MSEFNIIKTYFNWKTSSPSVVTGVGDDAAVLHVPSNQQLVTSVDTSIAGVHFPESTSAFDIAYKSLAVNLSDLAAMGATPQWFTLALTLPAVNREEDKQWLEDFSQGLKTLAHREKCYLVGGDTTQGHLSITIQVMGFVDVNKALLRSGAEVGDKLYVTGNLGDAALGLQLIQKNNEYASLLNLYDNEYCQQRLNQPTARLIESQMIKDCASACIDVSDGLLQDLQHILKASAVGAKLNLNQIPLSSTLQKLKTNQALQLAVSGGDDYELLFTLPALKEAAFLTNISALAKVTCIGEITSQLGEIVNEQGQVLQSSGYNHFS